MKKKLSYFFIVLIIIQMFFSCKVIDLEDLFVNSMEITEPQKGDLFKPGQVCNIKWAFNKGEYVRIDLCREDKIVERISEREENCGRYSWEIPDDISLDHIYNLKIRITIIDHEQFSEEYCESQNFIIDVNNWEEKPEIKNYATASQSLIFMSKENKIHISHTHDIADENYLRRINHRELNEDNWDAMTPPLPSDLVGIEDKYSIHFDDQDLEKNRVIIAQKIDIYNNDYSYFIAFSSQGTAWEIIGEGDSKIDVIDDNTSKRFVRFFSSVTINPIDKSPVITIVAVPEEVINLLYLIELGELTDVEMLSLLNLLSSWDEIPMSYVYAVKWNKDGIFELVCKNANTKENDFIKEGNYIKDIGPPVEYENGKIKKFYPQIYPDIAVKENGNLVVAMVNRMSGDNELKNKSIYCYEWNGDKWKCLKNLSVSNDKNREADAPSLVIDNNGNPVVIYRERNLDDSPAIWTACVKRYMGNDSWENLHFNDFFGEVPSIAGDDALPAIAINNENRIVASFTAGVALYNLDDTINTNREWINLGFPNYPGYTGKDSKNWLAINDDLVAVTYIEKDIDDNKNDLVRVKVLELPDFDR